jgi:hypothetical protein
MPGKCINLARPRAMLWRERGARRSSAVRSTDRWARGAEHREAIRLDRLWHASAFESSGLVLAFDHEE